jgi:uncharacterized protein (TIGR03067 family)
MKRWIACLFLVGPFATVAASQTDPPGDVQKIQGLWKATSAELEGKPIGQDIVKDMYIAFAGNRMIPFGEGDLTDAVYVFHLNPKTKIKQIDLKLKVKGKIETGEGIYLLDGDTLKLCWDQDGGKRPVSFKTPTEGRVFSVVLKREKP